MFQLAVLGQREERTDAGLGGGLALGLGTIRGEGEGGGAIDGGARRKESLQDDCGHMANAPNPAPGKANPTPPKPNDFADPHEPSNVRNPSKPTPDQPPDPQEAGNDVKMETEGE